MAHHEAEVAHGHTGDHGGNAKYFFVFVALCVLTGASFFTYTDMWWFKDDPVATRTFMMAVSCMKALLVMLFFMHLLWEANWKYVLTIPAVMMSFFLLLMLVPDVGCRSKWYAEERIIHVAEPAEEEHDGEGEDAGHGHEGDSSH